VVWCGRTKNWVNLKSVYKSGLLLVAGDRTPLPLLSSLWKFPRFGKIFSPHEIYQNPHPLMGFYRCLPPPHPAGPTGGPSTAKAAARTVPLLHLSSVVWPCQTSTKPHCSTLREHTETTTKRHQVPPTDHRGRDHPQIPTVKLLHSQDGSGHCRRRRRPHGILHRRKS
jgi:hypothetical protein